MPYTIQCWQWQYRVKAKLNSKPSSRCRRGVSPSKPLWPLQDIRFFIRGLCTSQYSSCRSTPPLFPPPPVEFCNQYCAIYGFPPAPLFCYSTHMIGTSNIVERPNIPSAVARPSNPTLAFTRYCQYRYCMVHIAIKWGWGGTPYCALVWAMHGESGVPKQRKRVQRIQLICAQKPRYKRISCKGQTPPWWRCGPLLLSTSNVPSCYSS